jgi:hypothetical protein
MSATMWSVIALHAQAHLCRLLFGLLTSSFSSLLFPLSVGQGHKGRFGHEFLEFEFRPDGLLRYANNSEYKRDHMIRKEGQSQRTTRLSTLSLDLLFLMVDLA